MPEMRSRRGILKIGFLSILPLTTKAFASTRHIAATAGAQLQPGRTKDSIIRSYYSGWENKQWSEIESLLANEFTFTSPNDDDHIDRHAFRDRCWPTAASIETIKIERVMVQSRDAFAKYLLTTKDGKSIRNTEYFTFTDEKIRTIEVYFGGKLGYPGQKT